MKKTYQKVLAGIGALVLVAAFVFTQSRTLPVQGSVSAGNEYNSTTTDATFASGKTVVDCVAILSGTCSLGSVNITGAGTSALTIFDATTTDVTKRAASMSTSTITKAYFPVMTTVETFTFDLSLKNGLLVQITGANLASTTITSRQ